MSELVRKQDETGHVLAPVTLEAKHVYGLRSEVIGNIHFDLNEEVIYPVEGVLAFHDYVKHKQRFLKLQANTAPSIITLNSTKQFMAILEITTSENQELTSNIVIYDLLTHKRQRSFEMPIHAKKKKITQLAFRCDSNAIVALSEYPEEMLYMFHFDKLGTIIEGRAGNLNHHGKVSFISCHPFNENLIAVCGEGVTNIFAKSEKGFNLLSDIKVGYTGTSLAWISGDMLLVGTKRGYLVLIENEKIRSFFLATELEILDLKIGVDFDEPPVEPENITGLSAKSTAIVCMTAFSKGLAYAIFNKVYIFERTSRTKYERKTILDIPTTKYPESLYQITNLAINTKQDTVIVTPNHNQIYVGLLIVPESLKTKWLEFETLGELLHIDSIVDICICAWRPIVISISKDRTIRVWNYQTDKVELVKRFPVDVTVIELFASGQYAAVGFEDRVSIMQIFMDDMNLMKTYNFPNAKDIKFTYYGHLMATAYESCIAISSVFNLETLKTLKGHTGTVLTVAWAPDDKSIFSGGDDGALFQWDIETGARLQELIDPGTVFTALCVPKDPTFFLAACNTGVIKKIQSSQVVEEIKMPAKSPLTDLALARSDLIMFAASKAGHLYNIYMPLTDAAGGKVTKCSFFDSPINKLRFSYDCSLLISCSAGGTMVIWQLKNIEGRLPYIDQDLLKSGEVLIPRSELKHKNETIRSLEQRLKQQAAEFYNKQSQNEQNDQQQMADTHKGYCQALAELKAKNEEIGVRHANELTQITAQIDELNAEHKTHMDTLAAQYSERMLMEYQKFSDLRESMLKIRDSYEEKLTKSKLCLRDTVEALELDFKQQLEERLELIRQLMKEMDDKKLEFTEYCRQVEIENDRKMIDCQIEYEKKVKFERDESAKWKNQSDAYEKKYNAIIRETDNLLEDVTQRKTDHYKSKAYIAQLYDDIKDLHKDVADREAAISVKEKRIDEILAKNQDLEKYKQVLHHKINELRAQIEPRELQIVEKRKQITEMEQELSGLQKNNLQLELQLKEIKDKCISANVELKLVRSRAKSARLCITSMCVEIYEVAAKLKFPNQLREGIKFLFHKYSSDDALKKFVSLDTQVQADYHKQRYHIEKIMRGCKQKGSDDSSQLKSKKLAKGQKMLMSELQSIQHQNEAINEEIHNVGILIKICKNMKAIPGEKQPEDTFLSIDRIDRYFAENVKALEAEVTNLTDENERISDDVEKKRKLLFLKLD